MRSQISKFLIAGRPMLTPDSVSVSYTDLYSNDSGRDESGFMHLVVLREKVEVWSFEYTFLTQDEKDYMEELFDVAGPTFNFYRPDRRGGTVSKVKAYRSNYGITWFNAKTGKWKNYKFNIIEC